MTRHPAHLPRSRVQYDGPMTLACRHCGKSNPKVIDADPRPCESQGIPGICGVYTVTCRGCGITDQAARTAPVEVVA